MSFSDSYMEIKRDFSNGFAKRRKGRPGPTDEDPVKMEYSKVLSVRISYIMDRDRGKIGILQSNPCIVMHVYVQ